MAAHAVAVVPDVDYVAPVEHAVEQCGGRDLIAEDAVPLFEALVRCQDHRGAVVTPVDELKEQNRGALGHRHVAVLIHDQHGFTCGKQAAK